MRPILRARPTVPLFVQLLGLIGLTVLASQVISLILIVFLPPPVPDFYRVSEVEHALINGRQTYPDRPALEVLTVDDAPRSAPYKRVPPQIRERLARDLGVDRRSVVIAGDRMPFADRRVGRIIRERMRRDGDLTEEHFLITPFEAGVKRADGRWTVVRPERRFWLSDWQQRIGLWFVLSALAMAPVAFIFARRMSAPIAQFAEAAERLGRDPSAPPVTLTGSSEIAMAARALNDMQERLKRYVDDRTAMMGAIAHDLRTPLTRLRFRIEALPEDQHAKISSDLDQMEAMISAALNFVRDATRPGERTPLELSSLLDSLCDEMTETGASADMESDEKVVVEGDPMALRRLFANLLDNAVKFGGAARVRVFRDSDMAVVEIDDDGPGVPAEDVERVFEPFYRREPSRSRQTGGIGLGLAVVRSIARGHGGDVTLRNRPGGLTAVVRLPA
ncbi:ATP-binding protein [Phenylobacterium immobile]|uniref:ATP-binding protein n=1 Tax=Phenylobacterium immobile TaxID=21 RepID=UPI000B29916B